ncbi:MAG: squalene-hopene/tetraprenyl-beta-curcumene cyclase [Planctomycetota bacterium]|jgi:squalene-hopene/tetraprenyl-beta-curcumene cyclase
MNLRQPFVVARIDPYPAYAMFRVFSVVLSTLLLTPVTLAQDGSHGRGSDGGAQQRQTGAIYKREVDGMIAAIRQTARMNVGKPAAKGVLGSDVLSTAKILTAMGFSHRRYHVSDGPVVRPSLDYLMQNRKSDGSFGDAEATTWVLDALQILNGDGYGDEIRVGREWLAGKTDKVVTFDGVVSGLLQSVRADMFPEHMASGAARLPRKWQASNSMDRNEAATALVKLVACQQANLKLDQMAAKQIQSDSWSATQEKAFAWLFAQQKLGVFSVTMPMKDDKGEMVMRSFPDPALTGFGLLAMQSKPINKRSAAEQEVILTGLNWLVKQQNADGTFGREVINYTTCVVVGALARWKDPLTVPVLARAQKAILMFQNAEAGGYERSDRDFGSIGYGSSQRGDLSNTHFSMEALRASGLPENHEAMQKALVFLQRTQNLKSSNDFKGKIPHPNKEGESIEAVSGDDGGAAYYPGNSAAGYIVQPDGKAVARSYGSMTYALLKSYTLAGVKGDDPRVQAAVKWIQDNWTLAINPGSDPALGEKVKYQGLYYYYMVLAQALNAAEVETVMAPQVTTMVASKKSIDWREALRSHLAKTQLADGTWINGKNGRWMESLPLLCTCYSMIALEHCK